MEKILRRKEKRLFYYLDPKNKRGKMAGPNPRMRGNFDGLYGDCSYVWGFFHKLLVGDVSKMKGRADGKWGRIRSSARGCWTDIIGNIEELRELVSGLSGDVSDIIFIDCAGWKGDCTEFFGGPVPKLTGEERRKGVEISECVK